MTSKRITQVLFLQTQQNKYKTYIRRPAVTGKGRNYSSCPICMCNMTSENKPHTSQGMITDSSQQLIVHNTDHINNLKGDLRDQDTRIKRTRGSG